MEPTDTRLVSRLLVSALLFAAWLVAGPLAGASEDWTTSSQGLPADNPYPPSSAIKLLFIHHSAGDDWLNAGIGDLGDQLGANNYYLSDTYYDWGPDDIGSNTDVGDWWSWFRGPNSGTYTAAAYQTTNQHAEYTRPIADPGGENQIIMFKRREPDHHVQIMLSQLPPGGQPDRPSDYGPQSPSWGGLEFREPYRGQCQGYLQRDPGIFPHASGQTLCPHHLTSAGSERD